MFRSIIKNIKIFVLYCKYSKLSVKDVFNKIYNDRKWGREKKFYSGPGSHENELTKPYLIFVKNFLKGKNYTVTDIGCGDFNIGKKLYPHSKKYIAIDIVEKLIELNKRKYSNSNLHFKCINVLEEKIPISDCIIIRQVLQHLDNKSIEIILKQIYNFKFLILTEHLPKNKFIPNIDKFTGPTIRLDTSYSGVDLEKKPFNLKFKSKKELIIEDKNLGGIHKTIIYKL
ncbi:MAG: class I SAM-dependent methyltransferase [Flavobacteriaceae bacterium]|nr:class I SAM-dependent methyltransferase [Flavobacteriaceae bacterium]MBL6685097.1 class I SAM-dependent methyltransferase [Flavobacteriaceae bacterium]